MQTDEERALRLSPPGHSPKGGAAISVASPAKPSVPNARRRDTHSLVRTSPKGPGQQFIGTCLKCGTVGLSVSAVGKPCVNPANITEDEALILAIKGGDQ